jgi:hypothetical protein
MLLFLRARVLPAMQLVSSSLGAISVHSLIVRCRVCLGFFWIWFCWLCTIRSRDDLGGSVLVGKNSPIVWLCGPFFLCLSAAILTLVLDVSSHLFNVCADALSRSFKDIPKIKSRSFLFILCAWSYNSVILFLMPSLVVVDSFHLFFLWTSSHRAFHIACTSVHIVEMSPVVHRRAHSSTVPRGFGFLAVATCCPHFEFTNPLIKLVHPILPWMHLVVSVSQSFSFSSSSSLFSRFSRMYVASSPGVLLLSKYSDIFFISTVFHSCFVVHSRRCAHDSIRSQNGHFGDRHSCFSSRLLVGSQFDINCDTNLLIPACLRRASASAFQWICVLVVFSHLYFVLQYRRIFCEAIVSRRAFCSPKVTEPDRFTR